MPRQNGTGPLGHGAMTGRGMGPCGGGMRRGFCRGFGRGSGRFGYRMPVTLTKEQEKKILEAELSDLKEETTEIEQRIKEL